MRKFLITAIVIVSLILAALLGVIWYQSTHIFVDGIAYAKYEQELDLREETVSEAHYLAVQANLPDCRILWNVPFQGGYQSSDTRQLTITTVNEEDIRILKAYFKDLEQINAEGCQDYAMLAVLTEQLPDCAVSYKVRLGDVSADPQAESLTLEPGSFGFETLMSNLVYLPRLQSLHFPMADLTLEQQTQLKEAYPQIAVTSTVMILGKEYDANTTTLDLSEMTSADVEEVTSKLAILPQLTQVQLMSAANGSRLSLEDVQALKSGVPDVAFQYSFDVCGVTISTADKEVILKDLKNVEAETAFPQKIRAILDIMTDCDRLVVQGKSAYDKVWKVISNEELAKIREEYQDQTKVVWQVYFGSNGSSMTDAQALRAVSGLTDDNSHDLVYCNEVIYMDIGHNEYLDSIDFVSGMTSLEAVIVSGAPIKSLEPFAACKNLKFLEMSNCHYVPDLEPLRQCTQLEMLNISYTKIEDISPLEDLKLTHLTTVRNPLVSQNEPGEQLQAFIDANPDCWTVYEGTQEFGTGWRTDKEGKLFGWYAKLEEVFRYSVYVAGGSIRNQQGWSLENK